TPVPDAGMGVFVNRILTEWSSPSDVVIVVVRKSTQGDWSVETQGYGVAKADGTKDGG
ncbi:hypothetical protein BD779DRAFT_1448872, partial [Infundibulicybe gibba]